MFLSGHTYYWYSLSLSLALSLFQDAHNPLVVNKMTCEQFVTNNRGINNGSDIPRELLVELYRSITANEIKMTDTLSNEINWALWTDLLRRSQSDAKCAVSPSQTHTHSLSFFVALSFSVCVCVCGCFIAIGSTLCCSP
ncbi:MAG TPA: Sec7 domain-containing protein [Oculatellaceae cyanobacterium]